MTKRERAYVAGSKAAWRLILAEALKNLGLNDSRRRTAKLLLEREEAVAALRQQCAEHGDNDWPDDLHLADVIEKHLWRGK